MAVPDMMHWPSRQKTPKPCEFPQATSTMKLEVILSGIFWMLNSFCAPFWSLEPTIFGCF